MAINTEFRIIDNYNTFCTLTIGDKKYCGHAECHADDIPIFSQRLGERLAYDRASIDYLRDERDKINEQIQSLKHLLSIYNQSQKTNKESYEYKMLQKQINTYIRDSKELSGRGYHRPLWEEGSKACSRNRQSGTNDLVHRADHGRCHGVV